MTRFTVILFEDGLQLVPSIWLTPNKKSCNWPPYTNDTKIKKAISNEEIPTNIWSMHKVLRLFGTSNSYESGMQKAKFAQEYSDLDYSDIEVEKDQRSRRKIKDNYSSSSDDEEENLKKTDIVTIPPPPLPPSFVNQSGSSSACSSKILKPNSSQVSVNSLAVTDEVTFLNNIGGKDSHDLTINILKRTVADELAKQYSWAGKLKKKAFKDLLLCKCIVRKYIL
ncbi:hypothetical protein ALC57_00628 [Trachymyrmex cornetzi]|uniref:DUF4806 domain-containing protein n=1 Tax=Trachymyrmex cornetzi TaxID=471704 RepID=A0A151JRD2_9HYME|nr:hypothetical protein ALC57_00628 [Trachymyrmex cornetzi]